MPAALTITFDKATYNKGDTVTATVKLTGADPVVTTVTVTQTIDGVPLSGTGNISLTRALGPQGVPVAVPALSTPFAATSVPGVFTATA